MKQNNDKVRPAAIMAQSEWCRAKRSTCNVSQYKLKTCIFPFFLANRAKETTDHGMISDPSRAQLDKILALADSSHDGEALVAVRKARQLLSRDGLSFGDLARAASSQRGEGGAVFSFLSGPRPHLDSELSHLRQQLEDLRADMQTQDLQLDFWRRRAMDLEQNALHAAREAERWKTLARETADRLWEIGQSISEEGLIKKVG